MKNNNKLLMSQRDELKRYIKAHGAITKDFTTYFRCKFYNESRDINENDVSEIIYTKFSAKEHKKIVPVSCHGSDVNICHMGGKTKCTIVLPEKRDYYDDKTSSSSHGYDYIDELFKNFENFYNISRSGMVSYDTLRGIIPLKVSDNWVGVVLESNNEKHNRKNEFSCKFIGEDIGEDHELIQALNQKLEQIKIEDNEASPMHKEMKHMFSFAEFIDDCYKADKKSNDAIATIKNLFACSGIELNVFDVEQFNEALLFDRNRLSVADSARREYLDMIKPNVEHLMKVNFKTEKSLNKLLEKIQGDKEIGEYLEKYLDGDVNENLNKLHLKLSNSKFSLLEAAITLDSRNSLLSMLNNEAVRDVLRSDIEYSDRVNELINNSNMSEDKEIVESMKMIRSNIVTYYFDKVKSGLTSLKEKVAHKLHMPLGCRTERNNMRRAKNEIDELNIQEHDKFSKEKIDFGLYGLVKEFQSKEMSKPSKKSHNPITTQKTRTILR